LRFWGEVLEASTILLFGRDSGVCVRSFGKLKNVLGRLGEDNLEGEDRLEGVAACWGIVATGAWWSCFLERCGQF